jgi:hypothetical protein
MQFHNSSSIKLLNFSTLRKLLLSFTLSALVLLFLFHALSWWMLKPCPLPPQADVPPAFGGEGLSFPPGGKGII